MRIKRHEVAVILLTCAFACFLAGYFAGRRNAVNIVTIPPQSGIEQHVAVNTYHGTPDAAQPDSALQQNQSPGTNSSGGEGGDAGSNVSPPAENTPIQSERVGAPRGGDGRININTASQSELMDLSGVGEVIAGRIIDYRNRNGPFLSIEEIMNVSGIGERRYEAIKEQITVG